jgi:hypothetical protein
MEAAVLNSRRIVLAMAAFGVCYLSFYKVPSLLFPAIGSEIKFYASLGGITAALAVSWLAWSMSRRASAGLLSRILCGAAMGAGIAFALSALSGPILYPTKPNHGLLVGVFLAAPAGAVLGGVAGLIGGALRRKLGISGSVLP